MGLAEQAVERPGFVVDRGASGAVVFGGTQHFLAELTDDVAPDVEVVGQVVRGDARWLELAGRDDVIQARRGGYLGRVAPVQQEARGAVAASAPQGQGRDRGQYR